MKKTELYFYLGDNGTIMTTMYIPGANGIKKYQLIAEEDKFITDGTKYVKNIIVPEKDLPLWYEVDGQV